MVAGSPASLARVKGRISCLRTIGLRLVATLHRSAFGISPSIMRPQVLSSISSIGAAKAVLSTRSLSQKDAFKARNQAGQFTSQLISCTRLLFILKGIRAWYLDRLSNPGVSAGDSVNVVWSSFAVKSLFHSVVR